jgi:CheY-like chemotaxis protein
MSTPRRILIIEDDRDLRDILVEFLSAFGHTDALGDGSQALDRLLQGPDYDVVLCDLTLPGLDGTELHEALLSERPDYAERFVFATGGAAEARHVAYLAHAGAPVVTKPFKLRDIGALVRELTAG